MTTVITINWKTFQWQNSWKHWFESPRYLTRTGCLSLYQTIALLCAFRNPTLHCSIVIVLGCWSIIQIEESILLLLNLFFLESFRQIIWALDMWRTLWWSSEFSDDIIPLMGPKTCHSKTMASTMGHHFLHLYSACALQDHLYSNDPKFIAQYCWIRNTVSVLGVGPYQYDEYEYTWMNEWAKYYPCILNAWIYGYLQSSDSENWLCHPSREGLTRCLNGCLGPQSFHQYCQYS